MLHRNKTLAQVLAEIPPPPPDKLAILMAMREEAMAKRPKDWSIGKLNEALKVITDKDRKGMLAYVDYSRGHITEQEYLHILDEIS